MRLLHFFAIVTIACLSMTACKSDKKTSSNTNTSSSKTTSEINKIATELCACMQPLIDLNKQIQTLAEEGKTEEISSLITEVERLSEEGDACADRLEEKYGDIQGNDKQKVESAMEKTCPEVAKMLAIEE